MILEAQKRKHNKRGEWFLIISSLILIIAMTHVFIVRPWKSVIEYALYYSVPLYTLVLLFLIYAIFKEGLKKEYVISLILAPFSFTVGGIMAYGTGVLIIDVYDLVASSKLPINQKVIISISLTLFVGILFYFFRKYRRTTYGFLECLIGITIGCNLVIQFDSNIATEQFYIPFLVSSVYLVVRGFDNIELGLKKEPIDPWAKWLWNLFFRP